MAWPESWLGLPGREFQSPHVSHAVTRTVLYCIAQTDGGTPHGMGEMGRRPTSRFPDVIVDHGYATVLYACMLYAGRKRPRRDYASLLSAVLAHHPATRSRSCPSSRPFATNPQTHKTSFPHFNVLHSGRPPRKDRASVCPVSCSSSSHRSFFSFVFFSMHHASCIMHHGLHAAPKPCDDLCQHRSLIKSQIAVNLIRGDRHAAPRSVL